AETGQVGHRNFLAVVVVYYVASGERSAPTGHLVFKIEVVATRRIPLECPPHATLERFQLGNRGARDRDHGHIALIEVNDIGVKVIRPPGTVLTASVPFRCEHEVIDDQLAAIFKDLCEACLTTRSIKSVVLGHPFPGEIAPRLA